jgi:hypothetical protein
MALTRHDQDLLLAQQAQALALKDIADQLRTIATEMKGLETNIAMFTECIRWNNEWDAALRVTDGGKIATVVSWVTDGDKP